ncbi:MAG: 2,3-bisphosphoglycerate-independent phosphoglycerate mutase [Candidatus Magasanikbacteria bacterium CG_4_10_14_0_8_um_filter_32_14]|uniref:2,3-bisphosphoglycerate-independent phosphoglycerate mutase n=2 Tax=Candidatus Magasanikiibacteriota TaxID=1752731 RepID=A0A2M7R8S0_9BACT|nr:MAG: phosphoglycerate mutase (2,3-diphosphoglycerate-independent) [Candidatus Magasanikbacteria bacterium CG1_02_32_51]PIY93140.1 MAG: 2,3-bisphosphoglycerate-independent phosphoglycerate mutase [Candidatus Magasanikbacteria bacterium CG_4_10_14_0_8_um_filter_32_14]
MTNRPKPAVLLTLSGWGLAPNTPGNAIAKAHTPNFDRFIEEYPVMSLGAAGPDVGLIGVGASNSRIGHLNIGAGRIYKKILPRINQAIKDGSFFENRAFLSACQHVEQNNSTLHIISLFGNQIHNANDEHFFALLQIAKKNNIKNVLVHAILDGEDDIYNNAIEHIKKIEERMSEIGIGKIVSLSGRYYTLDNGRHWDRTQIVYKTIVKAETNYVFPDTHSAIQASYDKKVFDTEFVPAIIGVRQGEQIIKNNDAIIFAIFGSSLCRQLTKAFVLPAFAKFERDYLKNLFFVTMTDYEKEIPIEVAFANTFIYNSLGEILNKEGLSQIRIAETEKYTCVTTFFNGMYDQKFDNDEWKMVPSKKVAFYNEEPEMSANKITSEVIKAIKSEKYDFILANFANADAVSRTGDIQATIKACEIIDKSIGKIADYVLAEDGVLFIIADHGNAEQVLNIQTESIDKTSSTNNVPFLIIQESLFGVSGRVGDSPNQDLSLLPKSGVLADVAPTILKVLGIEKPDEMTGKSLL